jgi:hypothetical protein
MSTPSSKPPADATVVGDAGPAQQAGADVKPVDLGATEGLLSKPTNPGSLDATQALGPSPAKAADLEATQGLDAPARPANLEATQGLEPAAARPAAPLDATQALGPGTGQAAAGKQPAQEKVSIIGDFKLIKLLGKGGMGSVYKAIEMSIDRPCALKVMAKHLADNKDFVERFRREARIQCNLDHPNIVRGYRVAEERGLQLFAMEFIDGQSVQGWLKKLGKFSVGDALHITLAVLHAMQYAHEKNMIHRDIKPDNVMITSKGVVKVADLGLAKALDEDMSLTQSGMGAGTPYYMSPEQAANAKHVDARTDIYAIGCMLYVFLTGQMPFRGNTTLELIKAKEDGRFDPVRKYNPEVPEKLDLIIAKMIQKKPEHRFQSCAEVIAAIEELGLANETLSFIEGATGRLPGAPVAAPSKAKTTVPAVSTQAPAKAAAKAAEPAAPAGDYWFIRYLDEDGEYVHRRLKLHQVYELIKANKLDNKTEASRHPKEGYRPLATYREFATALQARGLQAKAERRADKVKSFMENIEQEERRYKRSKMFRRFFSSVGGIITFILMLAAIAGVVAAAIYFSWPYLQGLLGQG